MGQLEENQNKESGAVITRRLTMKSAALLIAIAAVLVPLFAWILALPVIGDAQPWADSATTVASIIAMYMMVKAYVEQWYIWLVLDVIQSVKWLVETIRGGNMLR